MNHIRRSLPGCLIARLSTALRASRRRVEHLSQDARLTSSRLISMIQRLPVVRREIFCQISSSPLPGQRCGMSSSAEKELLRMGDMGHKRRSFGDSQVCKRSSGASKPGSSEDDLRVELTRSNHREDSQGKPLNSKVKG